MRKTGQLQFIKAVWGLFQLIWNAYPVAVVGIIFLTLIQGVLPALSAWIIKYIFDLLARQFAGESSPNWAILAWFLSGYALVIILGHTLTPGSGYLNAELGRRLTITIQKKVYEKINSFAGIAYFENPALYDTLRLAQEGAQYSSTQILSTLTMFVRNIVTLASFLGVLLLFSPLLVVLVTVAAVPELYARLKFGGQRFRLAHTISADQRQQFFYGFVLSSPVPAKEVRLFNLGGYLLDKVLNHFSNVFSAERRQQQHELRWQLGLGVLSSVVTSFAFVVVIIEAFRGNLTLGDITLYVSAVASVQGALTGLFLSIGNTNESILYYSYFNDLLALPEPLALAENPSSTEPLCSQIELRHLSFRYSPEHP